MPKKIATLLIALTLSLASAAGAAPGKKGKGEKTPPTGGASVISPIFSQLVSFTLPSGFVTVAEEGNGSSYIREAVLKGETVQSWTQMVTVTGVKGLSTNPRLSPQALASSIADGFARACPGSYSELFLQQGKSGGYEQFAAVVSCGSSPGTVGATSESALIVVIKGEKDYYTVQWAERGSPSELPVPVNEAKWNARLARLMPIRLCRIIPGEAPPYPSCFSPASSLSENR